MIWPSLFEAADATVPLNRPTPAAGERRFKPQGWCMRCGSELGPDWQTADHTCPPSKVRPPKTLKPRNRHERRRAAVLDHLGPRTSKHSLNRKTA